MANTVVHKPKGGIESRRDTKNNLRDISVQPLSLSVRIGPILLKVIVDLFMYVCVLVPFSLNFVILIHLVFFGTFVHSDAPSNLTLLSLA